MMKRRILLKTASALALPGAIPMSAWAQDKYPSKTIAFICPYAAGGGSDQRSRQFGRFLSTALGQPVIVDNKPGAGGNICTDVIAKAKPDGYVIGMGNFAPLSVNPTMFKKMSYDPAKDLTPIALIEKGPLILMVPPNSPYKSVKDIIAAAKAKPGTLSFASGGLGGSHHLSAEMFKSMAGLNMTHIPYKGGAPATTDLMGGQVDMMFEQLYAASPSIKAGKLRALAITSAKRSPLLPDVPTMEEAGIKGFTVYSWQAFAAPTGLPADIKTKLHEALVAGLNDPQIKPKLLELGFEIVGNTPEQFTAFQASEFARWKKVIEVGKITAD